MKFRVRYNQGQYNDGSGRVTSKSAIVDAPDAESARAFVRETKPRVGLVFDAEPVFRFIVYFEKFNPARICQDKGRIAVLATDASDAESVAYKKNPEIYKITGIDQD